LKTKGYNAHTLLNDPFQIGLLTNTEAIQLPAEKVLNVISELKDSANKDYERLVLLLEPFK
jgi:hypothetical protein